MIDFVPSPAGPWHDCVAFGLRIRSCLPLPELLPGEAAPPDVEIVHGDVPEELAGALKRGVRFQAAPNRLLLRVDGIARYLIENGRRVTIARAPGAGDDEVRIFLLGSALGALLHQRQDLVLHGSAIAWDGAAVAFLGLSGAGKSTLATAFRQRGRPVLTDDLCVVRPHGPDGRLLAFPGFPQTKLWLDSLTELEFSPQALRRIRPQLEKRAVRLESDFATQSLPLRKLYLLRPVNDESLELRQLQGPRKFDVLKRQTYRFGFLTGGEGMAGHFQHALRVAQETPMALLIRSNVRFRLDELLDLIEADLRA